MKWRVAVDRALAPLGLTHAKYVFLASLFGLLRGGRAPSQRELADETGLEALYISKLARSLEVDGLIERVRDERDTRSVRLTLTDLGSERIGPAMTTVSGLLEEMLSPLGGVDDPRTAALVRDLMSLLDNPLDPPDPEEQ